MQASTWSAKQLAIPLDDGTAMLAMIQEMIPLGLEAVGEALSQEVTRLAGRRYGRGYGEPVQLADTVPIFVVTIDAHHASEGMTALGMGAIGLPGGTVAVADVHGGAIRIIDPSGHVIRAIGRGAVDLRHIAWLGRCARDSIVAWDLMLGEIVSLISAGDYGGRARIALNPGELPPLALACSHGGTIAYQPLRRDSASTVTTMFTRVQAPIVIHRGDTWSRTRMVAGTELFTLGGGSGPRPLGPATVIAVASDRVYVGTGDSPRIDVFRLDGAALMSIDLHLLARSPSPGNVTTAIERLTAAVRGDVASVLRRYLQDLPAPRSLPFYQSLIVDDFDLLWVTTSAVGDSLTQLHVVNNAGQTTSVIRLPISIDVTDIGRDYIIGLHRTASGDQQVVSFGIRR